MSSVYIPSSANRKTVSAYNPNETLGHKALRWTAGRVAEVGKFAIYTVGAVLMLAKGVLKLPIAAVYTPIRAIIHWFSNEKADPTIDPFTLHGAAKDLAYAGLLVSRAANSVLKVIFAPREIDYKKGVVDTFNHVILDQVIKGGIHDKSGLTTDSNMFRQSTISAFGELTAGNLLTIPDNDSATDIILNRQKMR